MKKIIGSFLFFSVMLSCGTNDNNQSEATTPASESPATTETPAAAPQSLDTAQTTATPETATPTTAAAAPEEAGGAQLGKTLIGKSDCAACHKEDGKLVGPGFKDIASRYKDDKGAVSKLADKIINGGSGNWGQSPMTPHPQISKEDASAMVQYILQVK